jgi:hypothetical protein
MLVLVSMASSSALASSAASTGVLPFFTECLGPRTELAGLVGITWPITSQSNSIRSAASRCFTDGAAIRRLSMYAATCTGCT